MLAVLLAIPCIPMGLYGAVGVITGAKLVAGSLGAFWSVMAVAGAYELNRRKFRWNRGRSHRDRNLFAGTVAVSIGMIIGAALQETMPALAIIPALSAVKQASDGYETKTLSLLHAAVLACGIGMATWLYLDGVIGEIWLMRLAALP